MHTIHILDICTVYFTVRMQILCLSRAVPALSPHDSPIVLQGRNTPCGRCRVSASPVLRSVTTIMSLVLYMRA